MEVLQQLDIARTGRLLNQMRCYWTVNARHIQVAIDTDSLTACKCHKRRTFLYVFVRSQGRCQQLL